MGGCDIKVEFEIPDFVPDSRIIHIIAGDYERIGYVEPNTRKVFVKTGRCVRCGECCRKIRCDKLVFKDGEWGCVDGIMPVVCVYGYGKNVSGCRVKYEEQV